MTGPLISVIICAHNPRPDVIRRTLSGLAQQTLSRDQWELLVVDNASRDPIDISPAPFAQVLHEPTLGITYARLCGTGAARGEIIIFVDDDNVLAPDYLEHALRIMNEHPNWGCLGGRNIPEFETPPPDWLEKTGTSLLACRDPGDKELLASWKDGEWKERFPWFSPVGAGMVIRREIAARYAEMLHAKSDRPLFDRVGKSLSSGGDNDMVLATLRWGWVVAYSPLLRLDHLIASARLTVEYQGKLHRGCNRSWAMLLAVHGISPWPPVQRWTLPLRMARAWWRMKPWQSPERRVRFQGLCGLFEGRADVYDYQRATAKRSGK
ncbi:glycosyltransferase [bacterium]|nr:glycosyltransferase [bacterium]